jgi:HEAT repeat protein
MCGESEVDLMVAILGQSESRRVRRQLSETVVERCRERPERLVAWLSDPRWFVVRTVVHLLGAIGGEKVGALLAGVVSHPEPPVRYALVAALSHVPHHVARPLLLQLLTYDDTRTFCSALQVLGGRRDPGVATALMALMVRSDFERRPGPERRAVYQAIADTGSDAIAADLEAELYRGNWMSLARDEHRLAVARTLARIGTPACLQVLARGASSKHTSVRRVCEEARSGASPREEAA